MIFADPVRDLIEVADYGCTDPPGRYSHRDGTYEPRRSGCGLGQHHLSGPGALRAGLRCAASTTLVDNGSKGYRRW